MNKFLIARAIEIGRFLSARECAHSRCTLQAYRARSLCPPERRGIIQPRATPWEYRHHGSQALKGRIKTTFSILKSRTKPAWGNGLSPFQGSGCFNVYSQGVALGYITAAFQAGHPGASEMRVECSVDGRTPAESPSAVASIRNAP